MNEAMVRFAKIDALKARLDSYRPLDPARLAAIRDKFRIEWTYHTNAIEGNSLTLSETSFFLREGLTSKGKPLSEYLEARNHAEAIDYLEEVAREERPLSERLLKDFHAILMRGNEYIQITGLFGQKVRKPVLPGAYKQDNNHVIKPGGSIYYFCDALQVPGEMERLIVWHKAEEARLHPVALAAQFHHKLVAIHPFTDGNGRVARLAMNVILMRRGYTPAIIRREDREEYLSALDVADGEPRGEYVSPFARQGDYGPFVGIVARETGRTLAQTLEAIEKASGKTLRG